MRRLLSTFFLFTFSLALVKAQTSEKTVPIKLIEFFGTDQVSESTAQKWFGLKKNDPLRVSELQDKSITLLKGYAANGFQYTQIDSLIYDIYPDSSGAEISVYINEGQEITTGSITLLGLSDDEQVNIINRFDSRPGKDINTQQLERDLHAAIIEFEEQGYPFTKFELQSIQLDSLSPEEARLDMTWKTAKGPQLVIKEIQIIGNEFTKEEVILREIRINEGDIYDHDKVSKIQQRLIRLGYFRNVAPPEVFLATANEGGLLIRVEEGNTSKFDGVVGYTPGTNEQSGYFTGLIDINLGNLFGTGRALLAHWQKRDRASQDLMFHYREPWIAGFPLHLGFGFQQLIQDSTYIERDYGLDLLLPLVENFSIVGNVKKNSILPDSMGSFQLGIPKSETVSAMVGLTYDSRDDLLNPRQGILYFTSVQTGRKKNLGPPEILQAYELDERVNNHRLALDVEFFLPTFGRQVFALSLHGRQITSSEEFIPVPDQFRLGGTRSLRGYREDQFRGTSIAWTNMEYRYILGRRSRAFVFCDFGYYTADNRTGKLEDYKIGYGFGVRLETGLGIMGIDYGLAYGEKQGLMSGLLHVGLVNEF